jgi:hypothetical protein
MRRSAMKKKFIDISEAVSYPVSCDLTPEEEAELIAEYIASRTQEALEADYRDFEKQFAEAIPAEQLLAELEADQTRE